MRGKFCYLMIVVLVIVPLVLASCGDGVCEANECASEVDGKVECSQDCSYQCDDGCDNDGDGKYDTLVERDLCPKGSGSPIYVGKSSMVSSSEGRTFSLSHTVSEGKNRLLIVNLHTDDARGTRSVKYNGVSLTEIIGKKNGKNVQAYMYYLKNPPEGSHSVVVKFDGDEDDDDIGAEGIVVGAISFTNVNQEDPIGAKNSKSGDSSTSGTSISTTSDKSVVVVAVGYDEDRARHSARGDVVLRYQHHTGSSDDLSGPAGTLLTNNKGSYDAYFNAGDYDKEWAAVAAEINGLEGNDNCVEPECADGKDNDDADSLFDYCDGDTCDPGCASLNDTSEEPHDPDCKLPTDDSETTYVPPQCPLNQTILRISDDNKVLLPDNNDSENRICYDDIFGNNNTDPDPTKCTGRNLVLLVDPATGLASVPETTADSYTKICYDNLICRSVVSSDCASDEEIVVRLSAEVNATIGNKSSDLPVKICCKQDTISLDLAYWTNMNDEIITEDDVVDLDDKVKLVVEGNGIGGELVKYKIHEKCATIWRCMGNFFTGDDVVAETETRGGFVWSAGKNLLDGSLMGGRYYFTAKIKGLKKIDSRKKADESNNPDGIITVSDTVNNDRPNALIVFPEDRQIYFINSPIRFEQGSFDLDDEFSYVWDMGDGTTREGNSENLENYIFDYVYDDVEDKGQIDIKLNVTDGRGKMDFAMVSILVINSTYVLSYIDTPVDGRSYGREVVHNATSSYAVSSETIVADDGSCTKKIECLAGNCPQKTKGCPTSESLGCDYIGSCPVDVDGTPKPLDDLTFCWEFDNDPDDVLCRDGSNGALFTKEYPRIGYHESGLTVSIGVV